jgi:hypothetical protein
MDQSSVWMDRMERIAGRSVARNVGQAGGWSGRSRSSCWLMWVPATGGGPLTFGGAGQQRRLKCRCRKGLQKKMGFATSFEKRWRRRLGGGHLHNERPPPPRGPPLRGRRKPITEDTLCSSKCFARGVFFWHPGKTLWEAICNLVTHAQSAARERNQRGLFSARAATRRSTSSWVC